MDSIDLEVLKTSAGWIAAGQRCELITVIKTWGSSPRPVGATLAICEDGTVVGSVSGGCIEGAVVTEGLDAIQDGKPRLLDFGVSDAQAWEVGLACGGKIQIFVEKLD